MNEPVTKGMLAIDKPAGITSFDVIRQLRRITGVRKIGHTGTLDPFATGLLICLWGSYTRLASFGEAEDKSYLATVKLGQSTTTGDPEGEISSTSAVPAAIPNPLALQEAALNLKELPVPAHSAIKINGKRAYEYARKNQEITMPVRPTRISSFSFILWDSGELINSQGYLRYRCTVSKGTYIRSLSQWLAGQLGTLGYTLQLRRESIGTLSLNTAIPLAELSLENWQSHLLPVTSLLHSYPGYYPDVSQAKRIMNGNPISLDSPLPVSDTAYAIFSATGELLAMAHHLEGTLQPYLVFP